MELSFRTYWTRMISFLSYSFIQNGFAFLSLLFLFAMVRVYKMKRPLNLSFFSLTLLVLFFFWSFSAVNFFSLRYLLLTFPFLFLLLIYPVTIAIENKLFLTVLMFLSIGWIASNSYIERMSEGSIWHIDPVTVQRESIDTLKSLAEPDDLILTGFLMKENLIRTAPGYLSDKELFHHVEVYPIEGAKWLVISNIENEAWMQEMIDSNKAVPIWEKKRNHAWVKIYKLK